MAEASFQITHYFLLCFLSRAFSSFYTFLVLSENDKNFLSDGYFSLLFKLGLDGFFHLSQFKFKVFSRLMVSVCKAEVLLECETIRVREVILRLVCPDCF